ncbi:MAG: CDP-archaeol synthase, partial [Thermofilaceae archaeon]
MERIIALALPCYVANATPVIVAKLLRRTHPLDFGLHFVDGRRLLGDSKSIEGFIAGVSAGLLAGYLLSLYGLLSVGEAVPLSFGTMLGDAMGSFIKRRLGLPSGAPAP